MKKNIVATLIITLSLFSCATTSQVSTTEPSHEPKIVNEKASEQKSLYKGEGLSIAITSPQIPGENHNVDWLPQFMQDLLSENFVNYSKMEVLDSSNDDLTNAQLVVVGNVQQNTGMYELNFFVHEVVTNEIKASSTGRYAIYEIENGKAINEITGDLLEGLGIELSEQEKLKLSKTNENNEISALSLAKGNTAEKKGNFIEALTYYVKVQGFQKNEAQNTIHKMFAGTADVSSVHNRATYYKEQLAKWNTIQQQYEDYLTDNLIIAVYDFSEVKDTLDLKNNSVVFTISPGVRFFMNREAVVVAQVVRNEWDLVKADPDNKEWTKLVADGKFYKNLMWHTFLTGNCSFFADICDEEGNIIQKDVHSYFSNNTSTGMWFPVQAKNELQSQKKFYEEGKVVYLKTKPISLDDFENTISVTNLRINDPKNYPSAGLYSKATVYSLEEWEARQ